MGVKGRRVAVQRRKKNKKKDFLFVKNTRGDDGFNGNEWHLFS